MLKTIDAHAEGGPLRLVVEGVPAPRGRTMAEKVEWIRRHADGVRRLLMREPRGHADMCGALLTEAAMPGSHAGLVFMNGSGYPALSGHGVLAATAIALERGLIVPGGDGRTIAYDTAAGTVRARVGPAGGADRVTMTGVPAFVLQGGLPLKAGARPMRVDVAFGGGLYAIVDSEAAGLSVDADCVPELRRTGVEIARALSALQAWVHPATGQNLEVAGAVFTAPPRTEGADLRNVTVLADGQLDRSPGGTGTAAVMAVVDAMGLLGDRTFVHEGIVGTRLSGRVAARTTAGAAAAIVPEIEGGAWITGEHAFVVDRRDPLADGFRI